MRGPDIVQEQLFTVKQLDDFVPGKHPMRPIKIIVDKALKRMDRVFAAMYDDGLGGGRPSIAPEKLVRAMLLQIFYSIRSERQLMEQIQYNMLFRWFVGLSMDDDVWVPTVFTKNRERLMDHDVVVSLFNEIVEIADDEGWLSNEHFSVDGTLIQAWASHKSFVRKDGGDDDDEDGANFRGEKRSNETHQSRTDPDARLYRKGKTASELLFMGHALNDNRHGLVVNACATQADGYAERDAAKDMIGDARQANPEGELTLGRTGAMTPGNLLMLWASRRLPPTLRRTPRGAAPQYPMPLPSRRTTQSQSESARSLSRSLAGPNRLAISAKSCFVD